MGVVFRLLIRRAAPFARHEDIRRGEESPKLIAIPPSDSILPMWHPSALGWTEKFLEAAANYNKHHGGRQKPSSRLS